MQGWLQETLQKSLAGTQDGENTKAHTHHKLKDGPLMISTFGLIAKPKTDIQDTLERFASKHFDASLQHFDAWGCCGAVARDLDAAAGGAQRQTAVLPPR